MAGSCGTCTMCCRLLAIPELKKPTGKWCTNCNIGSGCKIYETRPNSCQEYECIWLTSQSRAPNERLPISMRPDKSKVVLTAAMDGVNISAHCDPGYPSAWQYGVIGEFLRELSDKLKVVVNSKGHHFQVLSSGRCKEVIMSSPDENGVQWFERYK